MMPSDLVVYLVVGVFLILLITLLRWLWHRGPTAPPVPKRTRVKREPKPFAGYIHKPECELCDQGMDSQPQVPNAPPPSGRDDGTVLSADHLFIPRLSRLGQYPGQRPS